MPPTTPYPPDFLDALSRAARAISGNEKLELHGGLNLQRDAPLQLAETIYTFTHDSDDTSRKRRHLRGQADLAALAHRYHLPQTHAQLRGAHAATQAMMDGLEIMRIEALGTPHMPGMAANLAHRHEIYCKQEGYEQQNLSSAPPLHDIAAFTLRQALTGAPPPDAIAPLVRSYAPLMEKKLAPHLAGMKENLASPRAFFQHILSWLHDLDLLSAEMLADLKQLQDESGHTTEAIGIREEETSAPEPEEFDREEADLSSDNDDISEIESEESAPAETSGEEISEEEPEVPDEPRHSPNAPEFSAFAVSDDYRAYTTAFDEIVPAEKLMSSEDVIRLNAQLQEKIRAYHTVSSRLATRLQRLLLAQQTRRWVYELDDGMMDNARLARVVARPDITDIYKQEHDAPFRDTVVSLLIDNSGSMRGRPITIAALSADILARTLERCGVKVEVLGFTTREWKGGESRKAWLNDGRPGEPGRLNDLRHIIYKSADTRFHRARRNLALMLKDGILKENIDGEAVWWAYDRLRARREYRRILMVISDGAPVDDSTLSANTGSYLDRHLREVIAHIERDESVELLAIGIGHDVTRYYRRAVTLHDVEQLGDTMVREITALFAPEAIRKLRA